jgi:hypothetical protein
MSDRLICGNCGQWNDAPDLESCEIMDDGYPVPATHEWITEAESRIPPVVEDDDGDNGWLYEDWDDEEPMPVVRIDIAELAAKAWKAK